VRGEPFALGTFSLDGDRFAGLVIDDVVFDLRPHLGAGITTGALLADWETAFARLSAVAAGGPSDSVGHHLRRRPADRVRLEPGRPAPG
jgi:hypothetical protein